MATFTRDEISRYLAHIGFDAASAAAQEALSLDHLTYLVRLQICTVPFENLSLHYSPSHLLSLRPDDLYAKTVGTGRGGYCMENNMLFGAVLRSLGFTVFHAGARVAHAVDGKVVFNGWCHMVNIVTIAGQRYLVDVGFGTNGPSRPVPMTSGAVVPGMVGQGLKVEYKTVGQHTDPTQKVWVYSHREGADKDWITSYAFSELEFFPEDFEVMNLMVMTHRTSFFTYAVMCIKVLLDEAEEPVAELILFNNELKRKTASGSEVLETFKSEKERIDALKRHFGIELTEEQQRGIRGMTTQLKG